jgi:hypothetical protein
MTMEPDDLDRLVDRALADLPMPRAPRTLRPRVMAAVALPEVGHPWFTWPWPLQVATMVFVAAVVGALGWGWPTLVASLGAVLPDSVQTSAGYVGVAAETSAALLRVMELTWSAVVAPIARLVLLLTVALCTACALCLAALSRVALGGASQS